MAKTREERKPECHFELVGEDTDIEALKRWVHLAGCEIFSEQGRPVLKGNTLDELDDFDEARSQASDIVAVLNGLSRTEARIYRPVRLSGSGERVHPDGRRDVHIAGRVGRMLSLGPLPNWAGKHYLVARQDANVRDALIAYGSDPPWQILRHAFEIARQDIGNEDEIIRRGGAPAMKLKTSRPLQWISALVAQEQSMAAFPNRHEDIFGRGGGLCRPPPQALDKQ